MLKFSTNFMTCSTLYSKAYREKIRLRLSADQMSLTKPVRAQGPDQALRSGLRGSHRAMTR